MHLQGHVLPGVLPVGGIEAFPRGASGEEPACQCRRCKRRSVQSLGQEDPQRRAWQRTPLFLPGESPWTGEPGGL